MERELANENDVHGANEIESLLATTPRLRTIFELFRDGKSVPRQSKLVTMENHS